MDRLRPMLVMPAADREGVTTTPGVCRHERMPTTRKALLEAPDAALHRANRHARGTACFAHAERT